MEFTLVQEGLAPLTLDEAVELAETLEVFFQESWSDVVVEFSDIVEELLSEDLDWSDYTRRPTPLEIMAACCTLERRGLIETVFIHGRLNFASTRATNLV